MNSDLSRLLEAYQSLGLFEAPRLEQLKARHKTVCTDSSRLYTYPETKNRAPLSREEALEAIVFDLCNAIVDGQVNPYEGARAIWTATVEASLQDFHKYDSFIYAASEFEDRPEDRDHFANEIVKEAERAIHETG